MLYNILPRSPPFRTFSLRVSVHSLITPPSSSPSSFHSFFFFFFSTKASNSTSSRSKKTSASSPKEDPPAYLYRISANSVAGLIGEHTFQSPEEALYEFLKKHKDTETLVRTMEQRLQRRSKHYVRHKILQENEYLQQLLQDYEATLDKAQDTNEASALYSAKTEEVNNYLVQQGYIQSYATGRFISHSALQNVHQRRGSRLENRSIQQYENTTHATVTQRNAQQLKKFFPPYFLLTGRIDGYNEATQTILEIKTRATGGKVINPSNGTESMLLSTTAKTTATPATHEAFPHDIIQVRCYMEMKNAEFAEISEHYQGQMDPRITRIRRDPLEWDRIYGKLLRTIENMERFIQDEDYRARIVTSGTLDIRDITALQYHGKQPLRLPSSASGFRRTVTETDKKIENEVSPKASSVSTDRSPNSGSIPTVTASPPFTNSLTMDENDSPLLMYNNIPGLPPL